MNFVEKIKQDKQEKFTKEEKTLFDIYSELYLESTPSESFEKLVKESVLEDESWKIDFMAYEIPKEKAEEIMKKHLTGKKYTKLKQRQFEAMITLGCSPRYKYDFKK